MTNMVRKQISGINNIGENTYSIRRGKANTLSEADKVQLSRLYTHHDKKRKPFFFNQDLECVHVFRVFHNNILIAARQIRIILNSDTQHTPQWSARMARKMSLGRYAIGSQLIVHPLHRNVGIGSMLISVSNQEVFVKHKISAILGFTSNLNTLALYLSLGVGVWRESIENLPIDAPATAKYGILQQLISVKQFRKMPFNYPIYYVYENSIFKNRSMSFLGNNYLWYEQSPLTPIIHMVKTSTPDGVDSETA